MKSEKTKWNEAFSKICLQIILSLILFFLGLILVKALTGSYLEPGYVGGWAEFLPESWLKGVLLAVFVFGFSCVLCRWMEKIEYHREKLALGVLIFSAVYLLVAGLLFLHAHPYFMEGDQILTYVAATLIFANDRADQYIMFAPSGYVGIYPQQKGLVLIYGIFFFFLKERLLDVVQRIHILYLLMILFCGWNILKEEGASPFVRCIYCFALILCGPLMILTPYLYGDLPAIGFSFLLVYAVVFYLHRRKMGYCVVGVIAAALMVLCRAQTWILLIAIGIILVLESIRTRKMAATVLSLALCLGAWLGNFGVDLYFENVTGYARGGGVPPILWVAMGLQETEGYPGVYNRYNQGTYEEADFDTEEAARVGREYLMQRLAELKNDPRYSLHFFSKKISQEWTSPDFSTIQVTSSWSDDSGTALQDVSYAMNRLYAGRFHDVVWILSDYYQSVLYFGVFLLVLLRLLYKKAGNITFAERIWLLYFLGGGLFFLFWENQSRYLLPFYIGLIPVFAVAVGQICELITALLKRFGEKKVQDEA